MAFLDLRSYLEQLEKDGLLFRVTGRVSRETELMPMVRWQYRGLPEKMRRAFLFTDVVGAGAQGGVSFPDVSGVVVSAVGASRRVYAAGLGCAPGDVRSRWLEALSRPLPTQGVSRAEAPCKEVIIDGAEIHTTGVLRFPFPISTPGWDPAPFVTAGHFITRDPETGIRNVGNYRSMVKAPDRLGIQIFPTQHVGIHWTKARRLGRTLEAAIVIGVPPQISMAAVAKVPYGMDELAVAGALGGAAIETVPCETVDIEVPARAEIVIEGEISTGEVEPEAPFGEFSGYMGERTDHPFFTVKCITHRRRPFLQAFISQFPPSEATLVRGIANEAVYYDVLRNRCNIPSVENVVFHEPSGAQPVVVIQMKKTAPSQPWQALRIAASLDPTYGKIVVAVDEDIDPYQFDTVLWALSTRMQPHLDVQITQGQTSMLDPSSAPPNLPNEKQWFPEPRGTSSMLIDATRKWAYPPVSLPLEAHMVRARSLWEEAGLPPLEPQAPWFGYPLGPWPEAYMEEARNAAEGRWLEVGEQLKARRHSL